MEGNLRSRTVQPAEKLEHIFRIGTVVLPVNLIGVLVISVNRTVGTFPDDGVYDDIDQILPGTVFRTVNRACDSGPFDDVARHLAVDLNVPVHHFDEIVHIRHHSHRTGHSQNLFIVVAVFDTVDDRVVVIAFDNTHDERCNVIRLNIFQYINFRYHVILRVILNQPERLSFRLISVKASQNAEKQ